MYDLYKILHLVKRTASNLVFVKLKVELESYNGMVYGGAHVQLIF